MGDGKPVEYFLFLLGSNAVVLVEEVEELGLWFFQRSVCAGLEVAEIGEDAFLEFLCIRNGSTKGEEAVC
jgi:hypothetical protein